MALFLRSTMLALLTATTVMSGNAISHAADRMDMFLYRPGAGAAWVARSNGDGSFTSVYAVGDNGAAAPNGIAGYDLLSPNDQVLSLDYNGL